MIAVDLERKSDPDSEQNVEPSSERDLDAAYRAVVSRYEQERELFRERYALHEDDGTHHRDADRTTVD